VKTIDSNGHTALFYAKNNKDIDELLRQHGCSEPPVVTKDTFSKRNNFSTLTPKSDVFDKLPASAI